MEIIVRKNDLLKELQLVQGIVERKNSIPILSNVLVEARAGFLRIAATDLDVSLRCGCAAEVVKEGATTLGAKKLFEIVRSLPESDLHLTVLPDAWTKVESERVIFKVAGLPKEDFPTLPDAKAARGVAIPAATMKALISRTSFAITAEDARYYLAGALLVLDNEGVAMVATDGHRLAYARHKVQINVSEPTRVLVPRKAINELGRLLEGEDSVSFQQVESHLVFSAGERTLASKTVEAQFPAFEKVIAVTGDKTVTAEREALGTAIRRVSLLSSDRSRAIRLALRAGRIELLASSPDQGEAHESLPVDYAGADIEVGFNAQYLSDFLAAAGGDAVRIELKDADSQGVLRPQESTDIDYRYVVMPMRF